MLILSWNVAGLSKTVQRIHEAFPPVAPPAPAPGGLSARRPAAAAGSGGAALDRFFRRHHADIVCLQEHKIPAGQLRNRSEPRQCSTLETYESFWACCSSSSSSTGATGTGAVNFGVATYCRRGTVRRADAAPLGVADLDAQGRCLLTDHGAFVLFNVYVPAGGGAQPLAAKMRFLRALRRAMERERRDRGVPVILAGDLNIALDRNDIYWRDRVLYLDEVLRDRGGAADASRWKRDVRQHWETICAVLDTKDVVATTTTNTHTGDQFNKYRLAVTVDDKRVFLGRHEATPEYCLSLFDFSEVTYFDEELGRTIVAREANTIRIQTLAELMSRIVDVQWSEETLQEIARTDATVCRASPPRKWLQDLLSENKMIDAFRHFYADAEARFTCWHQFTNRRYVNDGSRIDATLVDQDLIRYVLKGNVESLRCGASDATAQNPLGERAALAAATANGRFRPVSFEGGGIQDVPRDALETQFGPPHTGIVYTPPSFSDHVAISLLMEDEILPHDLLLVNDAATRKAQPHKLQKTIAGYFTAATAAVASAAPAQRKVPAPFNNRAASTGQPARSTNFIKKSRQESVEHTSKKRKTLLHHFQKMNNKT